MAKAVINLQKESGGVVKISPVDGIGVTEVTVPESGELVTKEYVDGLNSTNVKQSANLSDLTSASTARTNLGLGTAATRDVGTGSGNVMQVGAFGLGDVMPSGSSTVNPTGFYYNPASAAANGGGAFFMDVKYAGRGTDAYQAFRLSNDIYTNRFYLHAANSNGVTGLRPPVEIHHTSNILGSTGSSTSFPMSQKSVTDALNTKVAKVTSTDNAIARYNGTTGELQDSGVIIDDSWNLGIGITPSGNYKVETPYNYLGAFRFGLLCGGNSGGSYSSVGYNFRITATSNTYLYDNNDTSSMIRFDSGGFNFFTAPTGTRGNIISYTKAITLNSTGNLLLTSGTGALGYGEGAGGTVTQLTSKSTAVTLNKPTGQINMHNESLAAGSTVCFTFNNSLLRAGDGILINNSGWAVYEISARTVSDGAAYICVTNTGTTAGQAVPIRFQIIKGSNT